MKNTANMFLQRAFFLIVDVDKRDMKSKFTNFYNKKGTMMLIARPSMLTCLEKTPVSNKTKKASITECMTFTALGRYGASLKNMPDTLLYVLVERQNTSVKARGVKC